VVQISKNLAAMTLLRRHAVRFGHAPKELLMDSNKPNSRSKKIVGTAQSSSSLINKPHQVLSTSRSITHSITMSADEVAKAFVQHFYQAFDSNVDSLASLYVSPMEIWHDIALVAFLPRGAALFSTG
jgi:hypothetical protein